MFKIIPMIALASVSSFVAWCTHTQKINICHKTESGYVTLQVNKDSKLDDGDFVYTGAVDKHNKPTESCPTPEEPPVVTPPVVTPPVETPTVQPQPTTLPQTGATY